MDGLMIGGAICTCTVRRVPLGNMVMLWNLARKKVMMVHTGASLSRIYAERHCVRALPSFRTRLAVDAKSRGEARRGVLRSSEDRSLEILLQPPLLDRLM